MVEKDESPAARLELLSNTAMLKKVMERSGAPSDKLIARVSADEDETTEEAHHSSVSILSPGSSTAPSSRQGATPSPNSDGTQEVVPMPSYRIPVPPKLLHFKDSERAILQFSPAGRKHSTSAVGHGAFESVAEHAHRIPHAPSRGPPYHQTGRNGYSLKENMPPLPYAPPRYGDYSQGDFHHMGMNQPPYYPREDREGARSPSFEALMHENYRMREQLREKDMALASLQHQVSYLEKQISELRQLPTGKISHIPIE